MGRRRRTNLYVLGVATITIDAHCCHQSPEPIIDAVKLLRALLPRDCLHATATICVHIVSLATKDVTRTLSTVPLEPDDVAIDDDDPDGPTPP